MALRIGYCNVECVEQNAWIHFSDYARPVSEARNHLGTLGGVKSFERGAQIFKTLSDTLQLVQWM